MGPPAPERQSNGFTGGAAERWSASGGDWGDSKGRFDSLRDGSARSAGGGRAGQNFYSEQDYGGMRGAGGDDWFHRRDGRRPNGWDGPSERALFGDVKKRAETGIDFNEYDKIPVQLSGRDTASLVSIERFSEAKLSKPLLDNLGRCGYDRPTPVQKHSIPIVCEGRDVMACAQTGSGKTCAFMVPAMECLLRSGPPAMPMDTRPKRTPMPCVVVMAPTRELASQIFEEGRKFAFKTGIKCCVVYGGADIREQRRELNQGCDVLVATPGRLTDMFERGLVTLAFTQFLILDEADRMLDMGFEPQVRNIVEGTDMGKLATHQRQSMMFSATFPKEVQFMARDFLHDYVFITVGRVGSASELVEQHVVYSDDRDKVKILGDVLTEHLPKDGLCLIFVETKRGADSLERELWNSGSIRVTTIHGDRSQSEREEALYNFRNGRSPVLIATDVASRGLDIPNVHLVVNYDMPKAIDSYVHRIGRTGRAGRRGKAVALVNDRCAGPMLRDLLDILYEGKQESPDWFEDLCRRVRGGGGGSRKGKGKGKGKGGHRFGGRDARSDFGDFRGASRGDDRRGGSSRGDRETW